jgi:hypothetical protein
MNDEMRDKIREFLEARRCEALLIDPETADVNWWYSTVTDPYGIYPYDDVADDSVGRDYYARRPGSDIWVWFGDLPESVCDRLWELHRHKLAFPAGLGRHC